MGLVQRAIEAEGIPTVSITLFRQVTARLRAPRALHLRFPFGFPLGEAFDTAFQRRMIEHGLAALREIQEPGTIIDLPYDWGTYQSEAASRLHRRP